MKFSYVCIYPVVLTVAHDDLLYSEQVLFGLTVEHLVDYLVELGPGLYVCTVCTLHIICIWHVYF